MSLASLIRKRSTPALATAIPAISAIQQAETAESAGTVATIAVANPTCDSSAIISTLRDADLPEPQNDTRHFRWLIHFPECDPVEHTFLPEQTHAEVMDWHRDAIAAEPIPERTRQAETPEHVLELLALVKPGLIPKGCE